MKNPRFKVGDLVEIIAPPKEHKNPYGCIELSNKIGKIDKIKSIRMEEEHYCIRIESMPWRFTEEYFKFAIPVAESIPEIKVVYQVGDETFNTIEEAKYHLKHKKISDFLQSKWGESVGPVFLMKYSKELVELLKDEDEPSTSTY